MSFNSIKSEINSRYPFVIGGTSTSGEGHAVTVYGYQDLTSGQYVMLWDSNKNSGQGGVTISRYNSSGMTYTTANTAFTWNRTAKPNHVSYK